MSSRLTPRERDRCRPAASFASRYASGRTAPTPRRTPSWLPPRTARSGCACMPDPVTTAGEDWLIAIRAGDTTAFAAWLAGAEDRLRGCLRSFAEQVDVEAVMQETLVRIWQVAPRVRPDGRPEPLLRLAIRIGRNLAISELRRRRLEPVEDETIERLAAEAAHLAPAPDRWRDPLLHQAIETCRERLPARPAAALEARLTNEGAEPDARLAERLGMRLNTFVQNVV